MHQATSSHKLFFDKDYSRAPIISGCHSPKRYEDFYFAFPIKKYPHAFNNATSDVCYKKSVFGYHNNSLDMEKVKRILYEHMEANKSSCPELTVSIIQRKTRKILNEMELRDAARHSGFPHTNLVMFDDMTVREQFKACTDILVSWCSGGWTCLDLLYAEGNCSAGAVLA